MPDETPERPFPTLAEIRAAYAAIDGYSHSDDQYFDCGTAALRRMMVGPDVVLTPVSGVEPRQWRRAAFPTAPEIIINGTAVVPAEPWREAYAIEVNGYRVYHPDVDRTPTQFVPKVYDAGLAEGVHALDITWTRVTLPGSSKTASLFTVYHTHSGATWRLVADSDERPPDEWAEGHDMNGLPQEIEGAVFAILRLAGWQEDVNVRGHDDKYHIGGEVRVGFPPDDEDLPDAEDLPPDVDAL